MSSRAPDITPLIDASKVAASWHFVLNSMHAIMLAQGLWSLRKFICFEQHAFIRNIWFSFRQSDH